MLEAYQSHIQFNDPTYDGYRAANALRALAKLNLPKVQELVSNALRGEEKIRNATVFHMQGSEEWAWVVPMVANLTTSLNRQHAITVLSQIDTLEAWHVIEDWAKSDDVNVSKIAQKRLEERVDRPRTPEKRLALAKKLFAGEIRPDDLIETSTHHVWTENGYVPAGE